MAGIAAWRPLFQSYTAALPDFVKLADAFGAKAGGCGKIPAEVDDAIL